MTECICGYRNGTTKIANDGVIRSAETSSRSSVKYNHVTCSGFDTALDIGN